MDPLAPLPPSPAPRTPMVDPQNRATAEAFEAVFLGQMTQLMLESVEPGEFSGGHGEAMFRGVLAEKLGGAMAAGGGMGLQPAVIEQIIRMQGGGNGG